MFPSLSTHQLAELCHEVNRAYCQALGDDTQRPWDEAPSWQRESAIKGVQFVANNLDAPPSATHHSWMAEKLADGWVYGETKDLEAKTHPCITAYEALPEEQRAKDHIFCAIVRAFTPRT